MIKNIFEVQVTGIVNRTSDLVDIATVRFDDTDQEGQYRYVEVSAMAEIVESSILQQLKTQKPAISVGDTMLYPDQWACINVKTVDLSPSPFEVHGS